MRLKASRGKQLGSGREAIVKAKTGHRLSSKPVVSRWKHSGATGRGCSCGPYDRFATASRDAIEASRGADLATHNVFSLRRMQIRLSSKHSKLRRNHPRYASIALMSETCTKIQKTERKESFQLCFFINSGNDLLWVGKLSSTTEILDFLSHLSHEYPPQYHRRRRA